MKLKLIQELVRLILVNANKFEWTLQGFGMLRLHLSGGVRLNIWDSRFRVPGVSTLHSHPWWFTSLIVSGSLANVRYMETIGGMAFSSAEIKPGPGGGLRKDLEIKNLCETDRTLRSRMYISTGAGRASHQSSRGWVYNSKHSGSLWRGCSNCLLALWGEVGSGRAAKGRVQRGGSDLRVCAGANGEALKAVALLAV